MIKIKDKINHLKEKLYKEMDRESPDLEKILEISRQLDILILEYYKNPDLNILPD